jgi:hypothetical protein
VRRLSNFLIAVAVIGVAALQAADPPQVQISNQQLSVKMYVPDPVNGFYKGARFDSGGIISSLVYHGHSFYGPWFTKVDPAVRDFAFDHDDIVAGAASSAMGPVEEFQTPIGYETAKAGDTFVKVGVGVLKKREDTRYAFSNPYDIVNPGKWSFKSTADSAEFTQELTDTASGISYIYRKTIRLTPGKPEMVIEHSLKNTGKQPIQSLLYDHNFMTFDRLPTGDTSVRVPYQIKATRGPDAKSAQIAGSEFNYLKVVEAQERVTGGLQGFGPAAADYDFRIENRKAGTGIRIQGDRPLQNASIWSIRSVMAVEPFIQVAADPGKEFTWTYRYTYYTLPQ